MCRYQHTWCKYYQLVQTLEGVKPRICYHDKLENWPGIPHGVSSSSDIKLFGMFEIVPWSLFIYSIWPSIICISLNPGQNLLRWNSYALLQLKVFRYQFHVLFIFSNYYHCKYVKHWIWLDTRAAYLPYVVNCPEPKFPHKLHTTSIKKSSSIATETLKWA